MVAAESLAIGRGGQVVVARATGVSRTTIQQGLREVQRPELRVGRGRIRRPGGGRKAMVVIDPALRDDLDRLVEPTISVDTKKKELIGPFKNGGRELRPKGAPEQVRVHDFIIRELGRVTPYGVYDIAQNEAWVSVGVDHDTAAFAVESIRRWWWSMGYALYPQATRLLITADAGGSTGYRLRLWKIELQKLADETRLEIAVCHFPPGTSKWNKIEHRLFSAITQNWRGKPLVSHEVIVNLIGATTTTTGLTVKSELDTNRYAAGRKVSDDELAVIHLRRDAFHGDIGVGTVIAGRPLHRSRRAELLHRAPALRDDGKRHRRI